MKRADENAVTLELNEVLALVGFLSLLGTKGVVASLLAVHAGLSTVADGRHSGELLTQVWVARLFSRETRRTRTGAVHEHARSRVLGRYAQLASVAICV